MKNLKERGAEPLKISNETVTDMTIVLTTERLSPCMTVGGF